ncbi:MAG: cysteine hydrolase [Kordiimonadaceae bacterium]|jgi:ureidoacrylate peracid hydrolase|nr:cysteine hydrolase [Kordiimonadaceae bacterium]MBT6032512.1 cysteine hydrolase [Kordiimonadaceae bacterium]
MHKTEISQETLDAATRRRGGRRYAFSHIDPTKTALIVIDMQKYFMEPGMAAEVPVARDIVANINKLASSIRETGGQVAWVLSTFDENTFKDWSVMKDLFSAERCDAMVENLSIGGPGHLLWPEFEVENQDWHIHKNRFSAFINGSSDLEKRLKEAEIDTVIITGTLTDVCCESSARDAMMCNFKTIMITDANAAACDDDHNNALNAVARLFADVLSSDEMISRLHEK